MLGHLELKEWAEWGGVGGLVERFGTLKIFADHGVVLIMVMVVMLTIVAWALVRSIIRYKGSIKRDRIFHALTLQHVKPIPRIEQNA